MIEISCLEKRYARQHVLKDITMTIDDGEIYGLIGRSGAGKSTLLRCLNGLETYDSGSLKIDGVEVSRHTPEELRRFRKGIGMIFQSFSLMERKTVYHNVALPMKCWGYSNREIDRRVRELLDLVGLQDKADDRPRVLSGGQKQRVAIARALTLNPKILLCDEATSALDPNTTRSILALLRQINESLGIAVIIVTHQMSVVRRICHKVSILESGRITASGTAPEVFLGRSLAMRNLLGAVPEDSVIVGGQNIRLTFTENASGNRALSDMARELDLGFSIIRSNLERYRDVVLGTVVINIDGRDRDAALAFLARKGVRTEVVDADLA